MKRYYWSGICSSERLNGISQITSIVDKYATIINFQRLSDISLSLIMESEEGRQSDLYLGLSSIMFMEGFQATQNDSKNICIILLNITFTKGTGDVEIEVPNIPE